MGLKPLRDIVKTDCSFFMNEEATRGGVVVQSTLGSGNAMDQSQALVTYATYPSGSLPVGVLMQDVVNKDLTQTHLDYHGSEVQKGGKVTLVEIGDVVTNMIYPGATITPNDPAYLGPSGLLTDTFTNLHATPIVGVFKSTKDEDGYAKVAINLPMASPTL